MTVSERSREPVYGEKEALKANAAGDIREAAHEKKLCIKPQNFSSMTVQCENIV